MSFLDLLTSARAARRALLAVPRVAARDIVEGERVRVVGRAVMRGEPVIAPELGVACAYYHAWFEELAASSTRGRTEWLGIGEQEDVCAFEIEDDSGRVLVDGRTGAGITGALAAERYHRFQTSPRIRAHVAAVTPGELVAIIAWARGDLDLTRDGLYREDPHARLVLAASEREPIVISDDPELTS